MKIRLFFALITGKLIRLVGSRFGKATNLPGEIALKLCPGLLGQIRFDGKIIAVTGSNGKTTTANLIAHILKETGHTVANNAKGSNLLGGVATTLLGCATLGGQVREDYVVLEVDERFSRLIFKHFSPHYLLVTNLFRDQLTRNGNVDVIIEKLHEAIRPQVKLILNANDPISSTLAPENPRCYYRLERTELSTDSCRSITHDAKVCPQCFRRLDYEYYHYNHIGSYRCPACGFCTPKAQYVADHLKMQEGNFTVNGVAVHTNYHNLFHILNITAALAACCEAGLDLPTAAKAASSFEVSRQRYEEFEVAGRKTVMILSKNQNPVSFDQSISYVLEQYRSPTVVVYVNNINHTGHRDTTWLYDISFERLNGRVDSVVCTGPRAYDLAVRLKLAGFEEDTVKIEPELERLGPVVAQTQGEICILTELYDAKAILEVLRR